MVVVYWWWWSIGSRHIPEVVLSSVPLLTGVGVVKKGRVLVEGESVILCGEPVKKRRRERMRKKRRRKRKSSEQ